MRLSIHLDAGETYSNIGMAKALIESRLSVDDVREIAQYLMVFVENAPIFVEEERNWRNDQRRTDCIS